MASHLRLLTALWSGRESDGVTCELRSPKGLEGIGEHGKRGGAGKREETIYE